MQNVKWSGAIVLAVLGASAACGDLGTANGPGEAAAPGEIQQGVWEGDYTLHTQEDLEALRDYHQVTGQLRIDGYFPGALSLNWLRNVGSVWVEDQYALRALHLDGLWRVGGVLLIRNQQLLAVTMPSLEFASDLVFDATPLSDLSLPALRRVERMTIDRQVFLRSVSMPELEEVVQTLRIRGAGSLTEFDAPQLVRIGNALELADADALRRFTLPRLEDVGRVELRSNSSLRELGLSALEASGPLAFAMNPVLEEIDLLALGTVSGNLAFISNRALMNLRLPVLRVVEQDICVLDNSVVVELPHAAPRLEQAAAVRICENRGYDGATLERATAHFGALGIPVNPDDCAIMERLESSGSETTTRRPRSD